MPYDEEIPADACFAEPPPELNALAYKVDAPPN